MPTSWDVDPGGYGQTIQANVAALLQDIAATSDRRDEPAAAVAQEWHRRIYDQVPLPVSYYAGEVRDSDQRFPELDGYEVAVGPFQGVPSASVPQALSILEQQAKNAATFVDNLIPVGDVPRDNQQLGEVLGLCAHLHGEWVRIHPFANGNGRTARTWANWAAMRYGLPPFVTVRPRPGSPYAAAAYSSMQGRHRLMATTFHQMLQARLRGPPKAR